MRTTRLIAAALGFTALAVPIAPGLAGAQTTGARGTASSQSTVLSVSLGGDGGLLSLRVLGDDSAATTDATREAFSVFSPIAVDAPGEALDVTVAPVEVRSTGGEQTQGADAVSLSNPAVTGTISPATLAAVVDAAGARSSVQSALADLTAGGGLLTLDAVNAGVNAAVADASSEATRGLTVGSVTVLDLGAVLDGLGLPLGDLPVPQLTALLDEIGGTVDGVTDVQGAVDEINAAIDLLQGTAGGTTAPLTQEICTTIDNGLSQLGLPLPPTITCTTVTTVTQTVGQTIDALQDQLAALLGDVLAALDAAALLSIEGVNAGLNALATDSVATSAAGVDVSIDEVTIGSTTLPGLDVGAALDQVSALADQVSSTVGGVLGTIHADLANLVDVDLLEKTSSVTQDGDGPVLAQAGLTVARATITPPATLAQIVSTLSAAESVTETITGLGGTVPELSAAMSTLEAAIGGAVQALSQPSTVVLGNLTVRASHAVSAAAAPGAPAAPGTGGELPRTGAAAAATAFTGVLLVGAALGIRRWLRTTAQN